MLASGNLPHGTSDYYMLLLNQGKSPILKRKYRTLLSSCPDYCSLSKEIKECRFHC